MLLLCLRVKGNLVGIVPFESLEPGKPTWFEFVAGNLEEDGVILRRSHVALRCYVEYSLGNGHNLWHKLILGWVVFLTRA